MNKKSFIIMLLALVAGALFAQIPESLINRQIDTVYQNIDDEKYEEAYSIATNLLKMGYKDDVVSGNLTLAATQAYDKYLDYIAKTKNYSLLLEVEQNLEIYKEISNNSLKSKIAKIKAQKDAASEEKNDKFIETVVGNTNSTTKWVVWILIAIAVLAILTLLFFFFFAKANNRQAMQFEETLKVVAGMQQVNTHLLLGSVTDFQGSNLKLAGSSSTWGQNALPEPEMTDSEKYEFQALVTECEKIGQEIDKVTKRKNNSKNVSELVYKLAMHLGLNYNTSMAYFCAAMVYDSGFLSIPENLLIAETLTDDEKMEIKKHVVNIDNLPKVPEMYKNIFKDAVLYHHENMDGSGYPEGLKGDNIPQVARLIHVAESYTSLVSRRNYKAILDKDSAIAELKSKPELYDMAVIDALDEIV